MKPQRLDAARSKQPFGIVLTSALIFVVMYTMQVHRQGRSAGVASTGSSVVSTSSVVLPLAKDQTVLASFLDYTNVARDLYLPEDFSVCPASEGNIVCWLQLRKPVDCHVLFQQYLETLQSHVPVFPPPKEVPKEHQAAFTLHGYGKVYSMYFSQASHAPGAAVPVWTMDMYNPLFKQARGRQDVGFYAGAAYAIYKAVDCHPITSKAGAVFGSLTPWIEAILFANGAHDVTTIEFRPTMTNIPNHKVLTPLEWVNGWKNGSLPEVDFAFSFSSWEHDGLARYGDPLDPWGDIKAVQRASCYVKPGGLLFVGVPSSTVDATAFNAHRIYGPVRYPLLAANWEVAGVYDYQNVPYTDGRCGQTTCENMFPRWQVKAAQYGAVFQPVVVLRNTRTVPCQE